MFQAAMTIELWHVCLALSLIAAIVVAFVAISGVRTLMMTPLYTASVRIQIDRHAAKVVQAGEVEANDSRSYDFLKTEYELLQSRSIAERVASTLKLGEDPVTVIEQCAARLYDFHIKDVTEATKDGKPIEVGRGVIDIVAVLKTLLKVKFSYHLALEYEANADAPMPGITESIGFIRGALAATG